MQYMVRDSNRKEYGPIDLPTLIEWVRQGRVGPDNKVRNLTNGMLLDATHMPELNGMFAVNQAKQAAAINSGYLYSKNTANQVSDHWEDYKFVILMSVLGIFFSMLFAWFGLIARVGQRDSGEQKVIHVGLEERGTGPEMGETEGNRGVEPVVHGGVGPDFADGGVGKAESNNSKHG